MQVQLRSRHGKPTRLGSADKMTAIFQQHLKSYITKILSKAITSDKMVLSLKDTLEAIRLEEKGRKGTCTQYYRLFGRLRDDDDEELMSWPAESSADETEEEEKDEPSTSTA